MNLIPPGSHPGLLRFQVLRHLLVLHLLRVLHYLRVRQGVQVVLVALLPVHFDLVIERLADQGSLEANSSHLGRRPDRILKFDASPFDCVFARAGWDLGFLLSARQ